MSTFVFALLIALILGVGVLLFINFQTLRMGPTELPLGADENTQRRSLPKPSAEQSLQVRSPAFTIEYANADGEISERIIELQEVSREDGSLYLRAFCLLAKEQRTFRADRIRKMTEYASGQLIPNPVRYFADYRYAVEQPEPELDDHTAVMSRARAGLQGLIWIARADGMGVEQNLEAMLRYVGVRAGGRKDGSPREWNAEFAKMRILSERPTFEYVERAVGRMARAGAESVYFREAALTMTGSKKLEARRYKVLRLFS